jgi:hypothetical protein
MSVRGCHRWALSRPEGPHHSPCHPTGARSLDVGTLCLTRVRGRSTRRDEGDDHDRELERHSLDLRYARDLRQGPEVLRNVLLAIPTSAPVPLGQVAEIPPRMDPQRPSRPSGTRAAVAKLRPAEAGSR